MPLLKTTAAAWFFYAAAGDEPTGSPPTFFAAVVDLVAAELADELPGGLASDRPARKAALPFAVYDEIGSDLVVDAIGDEVVDGRFQVAVWAASKAEARSMALAIRATLRDADLSYAEGRHMGLRPATAPLVTQDPDDRADGGPVYRAIVDYRYLFQRT